uniref:Ig-like domain-containing protein n=1 Tax=Megaselia scalaris TaxID=36166 RepID=T1GLA5_MEGSC
MLWLFSSRTVYDEARSTTAFSQRSERPISALSSIRSGDYSGMSGAGTRAESRLEPETPVVIKTLKSVHVQQVHHEDAGYYKCEAINKHGAADCEAKVTVVEDKNIFGALSGQILQPGENPEFIWKRNGLPFDPEERFKVMFADDENSLGLFFQNVKPEDAGIYTCVAQTSTGNISCSAELTVQGAIQTLNREPEKPTLIIEHKEANTHVGGTAILELQCKGFPKPAVQIKHEEKIIENGGKYKFLYEDEECMSLLIKNVTAEDAGNTLLQLLMSLAKSQLNVH